MEPTLQDGDRARITGEMVDARLRGRVGLIVRRDGGRHGLCWLRLETERGEAEARTLGFLAAALTLVAAGEEA